MPQLSHRKEPKIRNKQGSKKEGWKRFTSGRGFRKRWFLGSRLGCVYCNRCPRAGDFNMENRQRGTYSAGIRTFYIKRRQAKEDIKRAKDLPVK